MKEVEFSFTLNGLMPLLMHQDDVMQADLLKDWRNDPDNKGLSQPGDDRSPPWSWLTYCYQDGERLVMPSCNLMVCLRDAGAKMLLKGNTTFKSVSQSELLIATEFLTFTAGGDGQEIAWADVLKLKDLPFKEQFERVKKLGFELFVKRANVNGKKHVRVRPRFNAWCVSGSIRVLDPRIITHDRLVTMFGIAGRLGLCDWRPSEKKSPGPWGQFLAELKILK